MKATVLLSGIGLSLATLLFGAPAQAQPQPAMLQAIHECRAKFGYAPNAKPPVAARPQVQQCVRTHMHAQGGGKGQFGPRGRFAGPAGAGSGQGSQAGLNRRERCARMVQTYYLPQNGHHIPHTTDVGGRLAMQRCMTDSRCNAGGFWPVPSSLYVDH